MREMHGLDRLQVLDADDSAYRAGLDQLTHLHEVWSVSQHVAYGHDSPRLTSPRENLPALLL